MLESPEEQELQTLSSISEQQGVGGASCGQGLWVSL